MGDTRPTSKKAYMKSSNTNLRRFGPTAMALRISTLSPMGCEPKTPLDLRTQFHW